MPYTLLVGSIPLTQKLNEEDWWTLVLVHHVETHLSDGALGLITRLFTEVL